ncbi:MAG: RDD family protein [bacterium]
MQTSNQISLTTPEGVTFSLNLASPGSRFLALLIDFLFIITITSTINTLGGIFSLIRHEFYITFAVISQFLIGWGYFIIFEWYYQGQTPGKKLFGLRVIDRNGFQLTFQQIILRNFFRIVDSLPALYLFGGFICMISSKYQRIGDIVAGTIVIFDSHFTLPNINHITPDKFNSFYTYPHLISRARQQISPRESSILLKALLRRDKLQPESRVELYESLANYFKSIINFPVEDISNEQYLRNLIGVLYKR